MIKIVQTTFTTTFYLDSEEFITAVNSLMVKQTFYIPTEYNANSQDHPKL